MADDGRRMIYPATFMQGLKYFPYKFYFKHCREFKTTFASFLICLPVFYYIQKMSFSEGNVRKYEDYLRKEELEHEHHKLHLEKYYEHAKH